MKTEIGLERPAHFKEDWPGMYDVFSHFEYVAGVPQPLFLITTLKENGNVNACFQGWSAFSGDADGFYAVIPGCWTLSHTYKNILRDKEFCVNFMSAGYYGACKKTIEANGEDNDELEAAGLTAEASKTVRPPRVKEAFLSYECKLHSDIDLSGKGKTRLVIGRVTMAAIGDKKDYMYYINYRKDPVTGEGPSHGTVAALTPIM
ncbi:MAG: flavin reductase [Clostridiales bacterium]|jgi:flavin reductase (DIM6/NTAB) family NADH-FMN oxidoreductase RutF|nr:flavin reductase [Clostridiales bacterium]